MLGDYFETIENNREKAATIFKENCDERNFGRSCYKYASHVEKTNLKNLKTVMPEVLALNNILTYCNLSSNYLFFILSYFKLY